MERNTVHSMHRQIYKGLISSDWNKCLAPCGPFDVITYNYPGLTKEVEAIFRDYTGNTIALGTAIGRIQALLPESISIPQMDAYLDNSFQTYMGVPELIDWCRDKGFLFMINTTGFMGYFQRAFARKLLPRVPVISANPMIRYPDSGDDPSFLELRETQDKGKNTEEVLKKFSISAKKTVLIGDSGGDGPHFEWGEGHSAYKIGCMAKQSLIDYCAGRQITINMLFGPKAFKNRDPEGEMHFDFKELRSVFQRCCKAMSTGDDRAEQAEKGY